MCCAFTHSDPNVMGTASDDSFFKLWDLRDLRKETIAIKASDNSLNEIDFNCVHPHTLVTGGEDQGKISVWDRRNLKTSLNELCHHKESVTKLRWSPFHENILASAAAENDVYLWDTSKNGEEQGRADYAEGPPELLIEHAKHLSEVEDLCWSPNHPMAICSAERQFMFQVWKCSPLTFQNELACYEGLDEIRDTDLE